MSVRTASRALLPKRIPTTTTSSTLLRRSFFSLPGTDSAPQQQHLTATRTLPYHLPPLYALIADVDAYHTFVPYCSRSRVTQWSSTPDAEGKRWPTLADLHVGWGGFEEVFTSRLRCVPGVSVEAISGEGSDGEGRQGTVFKSLVTRWSVKAVSEDEKKPLTEVNLAIQYQFANPLYAAVSAAVSDKVAGVMIEAFEEQAKRRLGPQNRL